MRHYQEPHNLLILSISGIAATGFSANLVLCLLKERNDNNE